MLDLKRHQKGCPDSIGAEIIPFPIVESSRFEVPANYLKH